MGSMQSMSDILQCQGLFPFWLMLISMLVFLRDGLNPCILLSSTQCLAVELGNLHFSPSYWDTETSAKV
jgi:hypothetical protein